MALQFGHNVACEYAPFYIPIIYILYIYIVMTAVMAGETPAPLPLVGVNFFWCGPEVSIPLEP
jgi:hypothetical protein